MLISDILDFAIGCRHAARQRVQGYPATEPTDERRAKISELSRIQVLLYGIDGKL